MGLSVSRGISLRASFFRCGSVAPIAAWRNDFGECLEVEFGDGLEDLGGRAVSEAVGQGIVPSGVLGLQGEQLSDGVVPALGSGTAVRRPAVADQGRRLLGLAASAIAGLSFGVAEGVLALRLATSWHVCSP